MKHSLLAALLCVGAQVSHAEPATGVFTATSACDAFSSFSKKTNPGSVRIKEGQAYQISEINTLAGYEWLRITVPNVAQPTARWVSVNCGAADNLVAKNGTATAGTGATRQCQTPDLYDSYVLAVTWQPGFCEYKAGAAAAEKPECVALSQGSLVTTSLSLHGLWPNRKECGTTYGYCSDVPLDLKPETIAAISPWMPNFYYSTSFGSYEWTKHGTCQTALDDDGYFLKAVGAIETVNASSLGQLIRSSIGKKLTKAELVNAVQADSPAGAGSVAFLCSGNSLYEIRMKLPLQFTTGNGLAGLLGSTPEALDIQGEDCPEVDINIEAGGV